MLQTLLSVLSLSGQKLLKGYNCDMGRDSHQATMYERFMHDLTHAISLGTTPNVSTMSFHPNQQGLFKFIKEAVNDEDKKETLQRAWSYTEGNLTEFFKTAEAKKWRWGAYHTDVNHHVPFGNTPLKWIFDRSFEGTGNINTVNVGRMEKVEFGNFETNHRANFRAVYDMSSRDSDWWIIDSGSSESIFSSKCDAS